MIFKGKYINFFGIHTPYPAVRHRLVVVRAPIGKFRPSPEVCTNCDRRYRAKHRLCADRCRCISAPYNANSDSFNRTKRN